MSKEEKIDNLLGFESSERMSIPINFWIGTEKQQQAVLRCMLNPKKAISYNPLEDEVLIEYANLLGIPVDENIFDENIFDENIYNYIKYGKKLPKVNTYLEFKEQWENKKDRKNHD